LCKQAFKLTHFRHYLTIANIQYIVNLYHAILTELCDKNLQLPFLFLIEWLKQASIAPGGI